MSGHGDLRLVSPQAPSESSPAGRPRLALAVPVGVAAYCSVFSLSGLAGGFFEISAWGAVTILCASVLIAALVAGGLAGDRLGWVAVGALSCLMVWSALSLSWSDAAARGWEDTTRLGLYVLVFLTCFVGIRSALAARAAMVAIGTGVAIIGAYVTVRLLAGGEGLFVAFRLSEPVGYINAEAAVFGAGAWVWLAQAQGIARAPLRGLALALAVMLFGLGVLTQSRGGALAWIGAALVIVVVFPGRLGRVWLLILLAAGVAGALPWLLDVYAQRPASGFGSPGKEAARAAGLALTATSLAAGLVACAGTVAARRLPRQLLARASGLALALLAAVALLTAGLASTSPLGPLEDAWDEFTSLRSDSGGEQRFTTAGGYRYDYWRVAFDAFSDAPAAGIGAGDYPAAYLLRRRNPEYVQHAHSLPLQTLAELGLPGALFLAVFVAAVGIALVRARGAPKSQLATHVSAGGVFVAWLLQAGLDWLLSFPGLTGMALISGAVLFQRAHQDTPLVHGNTPAVVGMLAALIVAGSATVLWLSNRYGDRAQELVTREPREAIVSANRALALNPEMLSAYYAKSAAFARLGSYASARAVLQVASRRDPTAYTPWALMGDLALRRGDHDAAKSAYSRASRLNPFDQELARQAANMRKVTGKP